MANCLIGHRGAPSGQGRPVPTNYKERMDLNKNRGEVCELTRDWGFYLELEDGKTVPVGVYSKYCDGAAHANAALKATPRAVAWHGTRLYAPLTTEEEAEA